MKPHELLKLKLHRFWGYILGYKNLLNAAAAAAGETAKGRIKIMLHLLNK